MKLCNYKSLMESKKDLIFLLDNNLKFKDFYIEDNSNLFFEKEIFIDNSILDLFNDYLDFDLEIVFNTVKSNGLKKRIYYEIYIEGKLKQFIADIFLVDINKKDSDLILLITDNTKNFEDSLKREKEFNQIKKHFEDSNSIMFILNKKGEVIQANQAFNKFFEIDSNVKTRNISNLLEEKGFHFIKNFNVVEDLMKFNDNWVLNNSNGEYIDLSIYKDKNIFYGLARVVTEQIKKAEKLAEKESNLRNLINSIEDYILVLDLEGNILFGNDSACKKLKYSKEEIISKHVLDMHPPELREEAKKIFDDMIHNKRDNCPLPIMAQDKEIIPVKTRVWKGRWNNLDVFYSISLDITKQEEIKELFDVIFHSNPTLMILLDHDKKVIDVNKGFLNKFKLEKSDILKRDIDDLRLFKSFIKDDRINFLSTKTKEISFSYDGKINYFIINTKKFKINRNNFYILSLTDITNQKEVQLQLHYRSNLQDLLMNLSTEYINLPSMKEEEAINESLRKMGKFVCADRVYIFEYDFERELTSNTYEWCNEGISSEIDNLQKVPLNIVESWYKEHIKGRTIHIPNVSLHHNDDSVKEILESQNIKSVITVPMMLNNDCLGFIGFDSVKEYKEYTELEVDLLKLYAQIIVNIKERIKNEKSLVKTLNEKNILLNEVHHRVKNNLQLISSMIYLQKQKINDNKIEGNMIQLIDRVKAMALLYDQIYKTAEISNFDFCNYIKDVVRGLVDQYTLDKKVEVDFEIDHIIINIDKAMLIGLVINELVSNSLKHAFTNRENGFIKVTIKNEVTGLKITVKDNGIGYKTAIDRDNKDSLGLRIVNGLVNQLDGRINRKSDNGTIYQIDLDKDSI